jgi:hypothetical protein
MTCLLAGITRDGSDGTRTRDLRRDRLVPVGITGNERAQLRWIAEHLGHADPGFTLRVYAHTFSDASKRRRVPIAKAIVDARRRAVDVRAADGEVQTPPTRDKAPANRGGADARTRTGDPFITSEVLYQLSYVGAGPSV